MLPWKKHQSSERQGQPSKGSTAPEPACHLSRTLFPTRERGPHSLHASTLPCHQPPSAVFGVPGSPHCHSRQP